MKLARAELTFGIRDWASDVRAQKKIGAGARSWTLGATASAPCALYSMPSRWPRRLFSICATAWMRA